MKSDNMKNKSKYRIVWIIGMAMLSRISLNTARRFAYPFAPALSRGLGLPLTEISSAIAMIQVGSVFGLLFGPFGDFLGYRFIMLAGLFFLIVGMLVGGLLPFYGFFIIALFLAGLGKSVFDSAFHAYVGQNVPYRRRGLVIGVSELSWAGSSLIGVPLVGVLIEYHGWSSPFFVLAGSASLSIILLRVIIPKEKKQTGIRHISGKFWKAWLLLGKKRASIGILCYIFFFSAANDNLFVVYGAWLENSFGLSLVALGVSTIVIGVAELLGESLTALLADRLGLKRAIILGIVLSGISYIGISVQGISLIMALTSIFIVSLTLEFTFVASLSFSTEIFPDARATMISGFFAASGIGRVFGTLIGVPIWKAGGVEATGFVSAFLCSLSLVALIWGIRSQRYPGENNTKEN